MNGASTDRFGVARTLRDIATLLELGGAARFKSRAYRRAASAIEALPDDLGKRVDEARLTEIEGVGDKLARQIAEIWHTGRSSLAERLAAELPPGSIELAHVPGLTVKRVRALHEALGTASLKDVQSACEEGRVRTVAGFGAKTEARILQGIQAYLTRRAQVRLAEATRVADELAAYLRTSPAIRDVQPAGELRRAVEVCDEIVLLASTSDEPGAREHFFRYPPFALKSPETSSARLATGLSVRLVTCAACAWPLVVATGPVEHVRELERRADPEALHGAASEARVYELAGLPFVPPELRDLPGVIEAAERGERFDDLVRQEDVRGLVHCHTRYSDGRDTIADMARAAERLGAGYITITDHSVSAHYAGGLSIDDLERQWEEIDRVQAEVGVRILRGIESDILADGALDYPDRVLERFDVIIASLHGRMRMTHAEMTERLERAMRLPIFKIWGHALGRLLLRRPPVACDVERVLDAVAQSPAAIEVNGDPHRMDLAPEWIRKARERGISFVLSTDAHSTRSLDYVRWSVLMARRGGLRRHEILNTREAADFMDAVRPLGSAPISGRGARAGRVH